MKEVYSLQKWKPSVMKKIRQKCTRARKFKICNVKWWFDTRPPVKLEHLKSQSFCTTENDFKKKFYLAIQRKYIKYSAVKFFFWATKFFSKYLKMFSGSGCFLKSPYLNASIYIFHKKFIKFFWNHIFFLCEKVCQNAYQLVDDVKHCV